MSQTAHEFVRTKDRREVYENCDVKCLFYAESVSEDTETYYGLSEDEIRFIQTAARGQNSTYSECLLATGQHGRRRLEIHSGPFEHMVLDNAIDPWEQLAQANGFDSASAEMVENLELTDLPSVMGRDMDIEMSMEMGHESTSTGPRESTHDSIPDSLEEGNGEE